MTTTTPPLSLRRRFRMPLTIGALSAAFLFPFTFPPSYFLAVGLIFFTWATLACSWNIVGGYAGYTSLGNSFGFGLGAYTSVILQRWYGISPFISAPIAGLVASAMALWIGAISFRTRGPAFLIITLSMVLAGNVTANNLWFIGGANGLPYDILNIAPKFYLYPFYYAMLLILCAAFLTTYQISRSKFGLGLMSIREDEQRIASMGVNILSYKVAAFAISLFFAGMVGSMYSYYMAVVFPNIAFFPFNDIRMVATTLIGGRGLFLGPLVGAALLIPMTEFLITYLGSNELNLMAYGAIIIIMAKCKPDGLLGRRPFQLGRWSIQLRRGPAAGGTVTSPGVIGVGRSVSES